MWETWVGSLGLEDPLEKAMAAHSSILAWRIPGTGEPSGLPSMGSHRVGHDWSNLPAAAAGYSPWCRKELDMTERLHFHFQFSHSVVSDSLRPYEPQASLSNTNSQSSPKPMSIESVMPSNHLLLCHPLLLLPSIFPSIRVFSNESAFHIRWPKYWSCSFSISPSNEYSRLISFRI